MMMSDLSSNTRTSQQSVDDLQKFFDDYKPVYKPLRIGTVSRKTKLEEILDKIQLSFEDYIWYTDVSKVSICKITNRNKNLAFC